MLNDEQRGFIDRMRVGRLATVDRAGRPHAIPVCFMVRGDSAYITIDRKPKSGLPASLQRLKNIAANPSVALIIDRYAEQWSELGWVLLRGTAEILADGEEHDDAQRRLRERYPQYRAMDLAPLPVIAIRIERVTAWGNLQPRDSRE